MQAKSPDKVVDRPEAYLTTIAVNLLRDRAKVAARRSTAPHLPAEEVALVGRDNIAALDARDQLERLQASLARLSPQSRLVFLSSEEPRVGQRVSVRLDLGCRRTIQKQHPQHQPPPHP